jgi:hypothetical protein
VGSVLDFKTRVLLNGVFNSNMGWSASADTVKQHLSSIPVPHIKPAFSMLKIIWSFIQQVQASKWQLEVLALSIVQILQMLDKGYSENQLLEATTLTPLQDLFRFVRFVFIWICVYLDHLHQIVYLEISWCLFAEKHQLDS